ncbi:MAG: LytR/AlgR family response regulator transcription factor [Chitinophagales bacterium]
MSNIKILVVEDDLSLAKELLHLLKKMGYALIKWVTSGEEAVHTSLDFMPDLLLIDIELEGKMNGIEAVKLIQIQEQISVIYISSLGNQHFKEAMETNPDGFVDKPFNAADLKKRVELAIYKRNLQYQKYAFVKSRNAHDKVELSDILWIEANRAYCRVRLKDRSYTLSMSLKTCAERLLNTHFVRVHDSFVVNVQHINGSTSFNRRKYLIVTNLEKIDVPLHPSMNQESNKIPISRTYSKNLKRYFKKL